MFPYDIALRPFHSDDDPFASDLDDIVVKDVEMFRAEQMSAREWWVCCYLRDGERITWSVTFRSGEVRWRVCEAPHPDEFSYEPVD